jgi:hypothetical protein
MAGSAFQHSPILFERRMMAKFNAEKTHCKRGHELSGDNIRITSQGSRQCIACVSVVHKAEYYANPEAAHTKKNEWQCQNNYGFSLADRDALLVEQNNTCPICGRTGLKWGKGFTDVWHIDHEHDKPGTHRGILCAYCNTALGRLEPHIDKVLAYLAKYK